MLKTKVGGIASPAWQNSTTEPPMLVTSTICPAQSYIKYCIHVKNKDWFVNRTPVSRVAGENSTTEPPMLVTSTICPAGNHIYPNINSC